MSRVALILFAAVLAFGSTCEAARISRLLDFLSGSSSTTSVRKLAQDVNLPAPLAVDIVPPVVLNPMNPTPAPMPTSNIGVACNCPGYGGYGTYGYGNGYGYAYNGYSSSYGYGFNDGGAGYGYGYNSYGGSYNGYGYCPCLPYPSA